MKKKVKIKGKRMDIIVVFDPNKLKDLSLYKILTWFHEDMEKVESIMDDRIMNELGEKNLV